MIIKWIHRKYKDGQNEPFMLQVLKIKRTRVKVLTKLKSVQNKKYEDGQKEPFVLKSVLFQWKVKNWIMMNTEFMMRFYKNYYELWIINYIMNYVEHWSFDEIL